MALAVATSRMAKRGVIVRRLAAVEGLGSCTLIASDKTGTLTCNELTVRRLHLADDEELEVGGEGFAPLGDVLWRGAAVQAPAHEGLRALVRVVTLCNEADLHHRDGAWVGAATRRTSRCCRSPARPVCGARRSSTAQGHRRTDQGEHRREGGRDQHRRLGSPHQPAAEPLDARRRVLRRAEGVPRRPRGAT